MKLWSLPLRIAARYLAPVLVLLSLVVLYRGHHLPGGGFIGGLLAASAIGLILLAEGAGVARRALRIDPVVFIVTGLLTGACSGVLGMAADAPFMKALWLPEVAVPVLGIVHLGTPLLFDLGVYLAVIGFVLTCLFALVEADRDIPSKGGMP
jgi:multisubunit Na+/H+ antiporter MnhB subunit